jgi:hypothetical protein
VSVLGSIAALGLAVSAADGGVAIAWEGPERCGDGARAQTTFDRLVGAPRGDLTGTARVAVAEEGPSLLAVVVIEDESAQTQRELQSSDCEALSDAVALVVAVALDPLGASATVREAIDRPVEAASPAVEPVPPEIPLAEEPRPSAVAPSPVTRRRTRPPLLGSVLVTGGGVVGLLPRVGGTFGGGFALGIAAARVELAAHHRFRTPLPHPADDSVKADVTLTAGRLSAGWAPAVGRFSFPMLAGLELGAFTARASGLTTTRTRHGLWAAAVPAFRPTVRATRWLALGLDLQLPVALWRESFIVEDFGQDLLQVGPVGFRFGLALEIIFFDESDRSRARKRGEP